MWFGRRAYCPENHRYDSMCSGTATSIVPFRVHFRTEMTNATTFALLAAILFMYIVILRCVCVSLFYSGKLWCLMIKPIAKIYFHSKCHTFSISQFTTVWLTLAHTQTHSEYMSIHVTSAIKPAYIWTKSTMLFHPENTEKHHRRAGGRE